MMVHPDTSKSDTSCAPEALNRTRQGHKDMAGLSDDYNHFVFHNHLPDELPSAFCISSSQPGSKYKGAERLQVTESLCNGGSSSENVISNSVKSDVSEISEDSRTSPDVCSSNLGEEEEEDVDDDNDNDDNLIPEVKQAYNIFHSFLVEKHKALTAPFWHPIGPGERGGQKMSFKRIDDKFVNREYESITEFVADFRFMLENCYRFHGVDQWISKQAQKLETILEQKLTLLSRSLREKTTLAVTSRGRFGTEDEKGPAGTSTRRRSVPRNLAAITVGGCESVMVQALRLEEQQRAKEEKRQRELSKKEAEEVSAKEVVEWERSLLSLAEPWSISTVWELPAIGHFLCLAQKALNLPEIVFFELERCLLMPCCSSFLAKVMTSLLCLPHRRATLHRRPALPYRRWEAELRQKVLGWYQEVGQADDQVAHAEQLGLCHQFFWTLGERSPLENTAFHLLPFNQRVWLLKGLCDNVYETQKGVQDNVLGQPIHECRESILGYDSQENAYIHFPHFCGADLRIYCQSPCVALGFPLPPFLVKKLEHEVSSKEPSYVSAVTQDKIGEPLKIKVENEFSGHGDLDPWGRATSSDESDPDQKGTKRVLFCPKKEVPGSVREEPLKAEQRSAFKERGDYKEVAEETAGKNCYKGKSPACVLNTDTFRTSFHFTPDITQKDRPPRQDGAPCPKCSVDSDAKPAHPSCFPFKAHPDTTGSASPRCSGTETGKLHSKKKKRKKKKEKSLGVKAGTGKLGLKCSLHKAAATNMEGKDKRKKRKRGRNLDAKKTGEKHKSLQLPVQPTFKLICTSLDELRDLISKTEDELDELESAKKRCERWYLKKESVKELHITLIRLLNELLPWEPKLLKAFQRNRARMKKESDDFKRHSECENFIREGSMAIEGDGGACIKGFSSTEIRRELEDEDKNERNVKGDCEEHGIPLGSDSLEQLRTPEILTVVNDSGPLTRSSKRRQSWGLDEDLSPTKRGKLVVDSVVSDLLSEVTSSDQNTARAKLPTVESSSVTTASLDTFQRHCKPIQALLARSDGNKVTLMTHPQAARLAQAPQLPSETIPAPVPTVKPTTSCQPTPWPAPPTTETQTPITSCTTNSPVHVVYNMSEGLGLVNKNDSPVKFSVQPIVDQKQGEKLMQQVIILPSNLLVQGPEETRAPQLSNVASLPTPKAPKVLSNSPGFTVPENKIPVQQVAPLKDTSVENIPLPAVSPSLQKLPCGASSISKKTTEPCSTLSRSPAPASASLYPNKCEAKQELKTVCIRESQSILVTTRGGNTGVVKVQTADQSGTSSLPSSPVFPIPPQFQALFVSKSSAVSTSTAQAPYSNTTNKLLPIISPERGTSLKSTPQSSLKCVSALSPSTLSERTSGTVILKSDLPVPVTVVSDSQTKIAQTLISVNSLLPSPPHSSVGVPTTERAIQGVPQTTTFKNINNSPLKKSQASGIVPEHSTFQKVFLVTPTTNIPTPTTANATTPAVPSAVPGSRFLFMSQSASACSTVTIPKGPILSQSSITAMAASKPVEAMNVKPNLIQATGGSTATTPTKVQGINISGLTTRIMDERTLTTKCVAPLSEAATKVMSSGQINVQKIKPAATTCPIRGSVKESGPADGKTVTFSTYGVGHMASSALLSAVDQMNTPSPISVSNFLNKKSEQVPCTLTPNLASPSVGTLINKDAILPRGLMKDRSWVTTPLTASSPVIPPVAPPVPRVSNRLTLSTAKATHTSGNPFSPPHTNLSSIVRVPVSPISTNTTMQEKVVINTSAPLAPGTQVFINNMRFVVPAQGLGSGTHVLLISSPATCPAGPAGAPVTWGTSNPLTAASAVPSPVVAPGISTHHMSVRLPVCSNSKVGTSDPVPKTLTAIRAPLVATDSAVFAQVPQLGSVVPSGQQSLTSIVRIPSVSAPEGQGHIAASSHSVSSCSEGKTAVAALKSLPSLVTPAVLQTGLGSPPPQPERTSFAPVISRAAPLVTMRPMSSTVSRMQTLPVATVPPIGGTFSSSQATPIATVPPSVSTVLMAPCPPVRGVQPGSIRMPVVLTNASQVQRKIPVQVPGVPTIHTPSKLVLSPDGAILNVIRCPALQNVPVMANTMTAHVVVPTCSCATGTVLNAFDSQRIVTVKPEGPKH